MTTLITPIIETIIKSSAVLGLTTLVALALRRQSAALRHTVWTTGLICALVLPLFSFVLPAWHVAPIRTTQPPPSVIASQPIAAESGRVVASPPAALPLTPSRFTPELLLFLIWVIGALSVASLLLREAVRLARVAFSARTVQQSSWRELVREVSHALALTRRVRLLRNSNASVLGTWGTLRPRVLLPRESESWSSELMLVVLGHELSHVKRNDWLIQILAETARAIYWFNPLFWIACTQLRRESEHACDDAAMNLGGPLGIDGPTYAGHVLDLARSLKHSGQPASAALAMASPSNLERRLVAMLNPSLNRSITSKRTAGIVVLFALGLTMPLAALSSQAPIPAVSVAPVVEFVSPPPIPTPAAAAVPVAPRPVSRTAVLAAPARPAAETVQPVTAQNQGGTLSGTILDPTGARIPGVRVNMTAQSNGLVRQTITNDSGSFAFTQLPTDNYSVTAELPGFQKTAFHYVLSDPGSSARFNVPLHIAPMWTVISITALAPPGLIVELPARSPGQSPIEPSPTGGVKAIDLAPATEIPPAVRADGRRDPIRVGGDLEAGNLMYHPSPAYPSEARNKGIEGVVIISGIIARDGQLNSLKVISSSNPLLETSALETIQSWTYKPTLLNREPVDVMTTISLNFTLSR